MRQPSLDHFHAMAWNNAWANQRLLRACAELSAEEFAAPRVGFFPSLQATLNHILIVDWLYVDALEGGSLGPAAYRNEIPCPAFDDLRREQSAVDRRLIAVCADLTPERCASIVRLIRETGDQLERADRVLLHLFQHQIHHRGQAHSMLSATRVPPPQLDEFFLAGDAPLRTDEVAALGLDESAVWPGDR